MQEQHTEFHCPWMPESLIGAMLYCLDKGQTVDLLLEEVFKKYDELQNSVPVEEGVRGVILKGIDWVIKNIPVVSEDIDLPDSPYELPDTIPDMVSALVGLMSYSILVQDISLSFAECKRIALDKYAELAGPVIGNRNSLTSEDAAELLKKILRWVYERL